MSEIKKTDKIFLTGSRGFLGKHLINELKEAGYTNILSPTSKQLNLLNFKKLDNYINREKPDVVIHLAGLVGGIGANRKDPAGFFDKNMRMGMNLINAVCGYNGEKVKDNKKFISISTTCSYPHTPPTLPFKEEEIWQGYPESTNAPYGIAKKALSVMGEAYKEQYGLNFVTLIPTNLYGPGDNFDLESSHVIPALIRKISSAKENNEKEVMFWGDGSPSRDFLFVKDCAKIIRILMENYESSDWINVGSGVEVKIKELSEYIIDIIGYNGEAIWDSSKPNGQPRRCLDVQRLKTVFKEINKEFELTDFKDGLKETIKYWNSIKENTNEIRRND